MLVRIVTTVAADGTKEATCPSPAQKKQRTLHRCPDARAQKATGDVYEKSVLARRRFVVDARNDAPFAR